MKLLSVLLSACALTGLAPSTASAQPDLVVLVRHAERAAEPAADPGLTPAGAQRARALVPALAGLRVNTIITTTWRRTRDTAAPLAQALGLQPQVVEAQAGGTAAHVKAVAAAVQAQQGVVLVVGHSNTVTALLAALGGPTLAQLCETSFHHVFLLQPAPPDPSALPVRWARFSYGEPSGAPGAGCL